jgi:hypothetical protein
MQATDECTAAVLVLTILMPCVKVDELRVCQDKLDSVLLPVHFDVAIDDLLVLYVAVENDLTSPAIRTPQDVGHTLSLALLPPERAFGTR